MARISGATVLLILVATVAVYTCAIIAGAALGRTLDSSTATTMQPTARDIALRVSVSFRGLAEDFAKELWGGNHREARRSGGSGDSAAEDLPSTETSRRDGVHEGRAAAATRMPESSDTELWRGYHREEGRSGGRAHAGAGAGDRDRAASCLPSSASRASVPLTPAELQYRERQHREVASLSAADRRIYMRQIEAMNIQLARRGLLSNFSGEITDGARPGGAGGVVKVGPWGGSGGQGFYMPGARSPGAGGGTPRLLSVTLYHADAVHAFSFEYLLGGVLVGRTMAPSGGRSHGSKGLRATINFSPDEHLTAVEGTFGCCRSVPEVVITSLTFRTDKGRTYGPYGEGTGTPFSIPAANGCIVGFWGGSGWLLDAIGVYIMPCQV